MIKTSPMKNIVQLSISVNTERLKELITKYPDYPIVVLAGEDANNGWYNWMYCSDVKFEIGEILECEQPWDNDMVACDREDFEEKLEEWLWDKMCDDNNDSEPSEEEFQIEFEKVKKEYDYYWKKVIEIRATN